MPEYTYYPDLRPYARMKFPLSPRLVRLSQGPMALLYALQRSDKSLRILRESVPRPDGSRMCMLIYSPAGETGTTPCLYFLHGGGFAFNAAPHHFALARELAHTSGVRVAMPDYRLAPRHIFPAAHEDALTGYRFLLENAAALCLMAREAHLPMPCAQMLLYPVLDARMETESYQKFTDTPMCNSRDMAKYFAMYAPGPSAAPREWLSPAERASVQGLPRAYIETAEFDCLRDEGAAYAARLTREGVACEYHAIKNAMHGYDIAGKSDFLKAVMAYRIKFLRDVSVD